MPARIYSPESVAKLERESREGMEFELRGKDIVARMETMRRLILERQKTLKEKTGPLFDRLLTTRQMADMIFRPDDSPEQRINIETIRIWFSFNQVINKVRYSAVIYEFHKLFMSVGAQYGSYPSNALPPLTPYAVALEDINDTYRVYTFEENTFTALGELYDKLYVLNYRSEIVLNFGGRDTSGKARKISNTSIQTNTKFFADINNRKLDSFKITTMVQNPRISRDISFKKEELRGVEFFTGEYPAATLDKNATAITGAERDANWERRTETFITSFNGLFNDKRAGGYIGVSYLTLPDLIKDDTDTSGVAGLLFEWNYFFESVPILGFGMKFDILSDFDNSSDYTDRWDITYYDIALLGFGRLPLTPVRVNLQAYAGAGYSHLSIEEKKWGSKRDYSSSGLSTMYGAGIEKYFDIFSIAIRYRLVIPPALKSASGKTTDPLQGFEVCFGAVW
jgi:hypothetical protein